MLIRFRWALEPPPWPNHSSREGFTAVDRPRPPLAGSRPGSTRPATSPYSPQDRRRTPLARWDFTLRAPDGTEARWTWNEFEALPHETVKADIHCVTKWSKLDTVWHGVSVDTLLAEAERAGCIRRRTCSRCPTAAIQQPAACRRHRRKSLGRGDIRRRAARTRAWGPARLLVPHLYFWKSAKWIRQFRLVEDDDAGFWESLGYHNYGDPGASSGTAVTREWRRGSRTISSGADRMADIVQCGLGRRKPQQIKDLARPWIVRRCK